MRTARIVVITAGLSQPSSTRLLADRLAQAIGSALGSARESAGVAAEITTVELREVARDVTNNLVTGFPSPVLAGILDQVAGADGLIVVSPIFSGSYSGLFKMFFDVLDPEALVGTPVLIAATGGTARHSLALEYALRPLFAYLRAVVVPTAVFAAPEDWASEGILAGRVERAAGELAGLLAGSTARAEPGAEVVSFDRLLRRAHS